MEKGFNVYFLGGLNPSPFSFYLCTFLYEIRSMTSKCAVYMDDLRLSVHHGQRILLLRNANEHSVKALTDH